MISRYLPWIWAGQGVEFLSPLDGAERSQRKQQQVKKKIKHKTYLYK